MWEELTERGERGFDRLVISTVLRDRKLKDGMEL